MKPWRTLRLWLAVLSIGWPAVVSAQAGSPPAASKPAPARGATGADSAKPDEPPSAGEGPTVDAATPGAAPAPPGEDREYADSDPRAITDFKPYLDPHGRWVDDPKYGLVWVPDPARVGAEFAPYVSSGHWALTEGGNYVWVSDYPFGWVVFHYGRWVWTESNGWAWIPGRLYSDAWVVWRVPVGPYDYVGWAPAPPAYVWRNGVAVSVWYTPSLAYVFVPSAYLFSPYPYDYVVLYPRTVWLIAHQTRRYHSPITRVRQTGPSFSTARIPAEARPTSRVRVDPRAIAAATAGGTRRLVTGRVIVPPAPNERRSAERRPTGTRQTLDRGAPRAAPRPPVSRAEPPPRASRRRPVYQRRESDRPIAPSVWRPRMETPPRLRPNQRVPRR